MKNYFKIFSLVSATATLLFGCNSTQTPTPTPTATGTLIKTEDHVVQNSSNGSSTDNYTTHTDYVYDAQNRVICEMTLQKGPYVVTNGAFASQTTNTNITYDYSVSGSVKMTTIKNQATGNQPFTSTTTVQNLALTAGLWSTTTRTYDANQYLTYDGTLYYNDVASSGTQENPLKSSGCVGGINNLCNPLNTGTNPFPNLATYTYVYNTLVNTLDNENHGKAFLGKTSYNAPTARTFSQLGSVSIGNGLNNTHYTIYTQDSQNRIISYTITNGIYVVDNVTVSY